MKETQKRQDFESAVRQFLCDLDVGDPYDGTWYQPYQTFENLLLRDRSYRPVRLIVPVSAWLDLLKTFDVVFEKKIQTKLTMETVRVFVKAVADSSGNRHPFCDRAIAKHINASYENLYRKFNFQGEMLVPLYNVHCRPELKDGVRLSKATLYPGHDESLLATSIEESPSLKDYYANEINCSYLAISVSGDSESCLTQYERESENALKVLRFIVGGDYVFDENRRKWMNEGRSISLRDYEIQKPILLVPQESRIESPLPRLRGTMSMTNETVRVAREYYGLEDINYHYMN